MIFVWELSRTVFQYITPSSDKLRCVAWDLWHLISVMPKNQSFIQDWYQIVLKQLDVFGIIQVTTFLSNFLELSLLMYPQRIRHLTLNFFCFRHATWVLSLPLRFYKKLKRNFILVSFWICSFFIMHPVNHTFDQLTLAFKYFFVNAGSCSRVLRLLVSTDTK